VAAAWFGASGKANRQCWRLLRFFALYGAVPHLFSSDMLSSFIRHFTWNGFISTLHHLPGNSTILKQTVEVDHYFFIKVTLIFARSIL